MKNTEHTYGSLSKFFHWSISVLVILMLSCSFFIDSIPKDFKGLAMTTHKSTGLTILLLMVARIVWALLNVKPKLPSSIPRIQQFAAHAIHHAFYLLLILMPLSGWIMSTAAGKIPKFLGLVLLPLPGIPQDKALAGLFHDLHTIFAWVIIALLVLHILAALKHHFINKDDVLTRMLP